MTVINKIKTIFQERRTIGLGKNKRKLQIQKPCKKFFFIKKVTFNLTRVYASAIFSREKKKEKTEQL